MRGPYSFVRHGVDARCQTHEHALDARGGRARRLVRRVENDGRGRGGGGAELLVGLVVPVEEDPVARDAGRLREGELPERRDVGADSLVGENLEDRDVRERLRPVHDKRPGRRLGVGSRLRADRLLAVDEKRRPVDRRQLGRRDAADRERSTVGPCGIGEEIEHDPASIRRR